MAILATDGFEESELFQPLEALREAGANPKIVSLSDTSEQIRGWKNGEWSRTIDVDLTVDETEASRFDGLVLPGGVMNPDRLRMNADAVGFVRDFFSQHKPVAAICHAPWLLIEAGVVEDREVTSWPSLRKDLENAGANWVDREVVVDEGLVTSRSPKDLPAFNAKLLEELSEGVHVRQTV